MKPYLILAVFLLAACDKPGPAMDFRHKKPEGGKPIATWSSDSITDVELKTRFAEMSPYQRARYQTLEQKRDYVDGLARFELLVQEAGKRGLQNDPEVIDATKKVMVQRLLAQEGYDSGTRDGVYGGKLNAAIRAFERAEGRGETGLATAALLKRLAALDAQRRGRGPVGLPPSDVETGSVGSHNVTGGTARLPR